MDMIAGAGRVDAGVGGPGYVEQLRVPAMSLGTYSLRAGAVDGQRPHTEDEVYVVTAGRARFTGGGETVEVSPGTVLYVPAGEEHRFHDITADLTVLVVFAPAEGSGGAAALSAVESGADAAPHPLIG